jgi:hypothetical protein
MLAGVTAAHHHLNATRSAGSSHLDAYTVAMLEEAERKEENDEMMDPPFFSQAVYVCLRVGSCVWGLGLLAFHIIVIYALVVTHTQSVMDACGASLWIFLLVHLLLPMVLTCILCCALLCVYLLASNLMLSVQQAPFYYWALIFMAITYFAVLCGVGAHLTSKAAGNSACIAAVGTATNNMPQLLTSLGWVYVGLDGADLLLSLAVMVALWYIQYVLP